MSRYCGDKDLKPILDAAIAWRDRCLLDDGSVFLDKNIWNRKNIEQLDKDFVQNLDYGEGNFFEKLEKQLEASDPSVKQLAAEVMWVMLLCPSNIGADKKRETVEKNLELERLFATNYASAVEKRSSTRYWEWWS